LRGLRKILLIFRSAFAAAKNAVSVLREWRGVEKILAAKNKVKDIFRVAIRENPMDRTTSNAREIVAAEARKRHELTASLRAARLAKEELPSPAPSPKPKASR